MDVGHQRFNPKELLDYIGLDSTDLQTYKSGA